ncbi:MAG TPA: hypothetical protein VJ901_19250 [Thermoanaerobaculia bacterium]|nr:hypothetical protein [Thermoanaerobaculia bacterium]
MRRLFLIAFIAFASAASASDSLQWSGFALLRASNESRIPLEDDKLAAQLQLGLDWRPSLTLGAHVHLVARNEADGSRRGHFGVTEAFLEQNVHRGEDRLHIMEGAFFLPTTRENVDALWESPYTITPSALNSWLGEEFRPIGVDVAYTLRHSLTFGATAFRGNDTFGALPAARGWMMRDHWALLGEHLPVDGTYFTSVSAETDHRLGWSTRARWNSDNFVAQLTHIDNRSDAEEHGELDNWETRFDIAGAEYTLNDWTLAAESGWGPTTVRFPGGQFTANLLSEYALLSRRFANGRATIRADKFNHHHAITLAYFFSPPGKLRTGVEVVKVGSEKRVSVEMRYSFAGK